MVDSERTVKQNYLRVEIVEKGFDSEAFLNFLSEIKGEDAAEIDNWTIDELKEAVFNFKARLAKDQNTQQNVAANQRTLSQGSEGAVSYQMTPQTNAELLTSTTTDDSGPMPKDFKVENYEEVIECQKCETTALSDKMDVLRIVISSPEKVEGGLFSSAYVTYLVTTLPLNYVVRRRYSDFEWLRKILFTLFPGVPIAPLPKKSYSGRFNEQFIMKRMRYLNKFIDALSKNEVILNSQIFHDFLQVQDKDQFANKQKDYNKLKAPVKLNEHRTISGKFKLRLTKEYDICLENFKNYLNFNEAILKKLTTSIKLLNIEMLTVSNRMKEISDIFGQMYTASEKASDNVTVKQTYKMLSLLTKGWSESNLKQSGLIEYELKEYFNYIRKEFMSFKDIQQKVDTNREAYYKAESKLNMKKEELFKQGNVNKWDMNFEDLKKYDKTDFIKNKELSFSKMLPKETSHVHLLKQHYSYYINQFFNEYDKLANLNGARFKKHFVEVSEKHTDILTDLHVKWADLLSFYSEVYDSNLHKQQV